MLGPRLRLFFAFGMLSLLVGCASAPPPKPTPKPPDKATLALQKNRELERKNKELSQRIAEIERLRKKDIQQREESLKNLDTTLVMMEDKLLSLQSQLEAGKKAAALAKKKAQINSAASRPPLPQAPAPPKARAALKGPPSIPRAATRGSAPAKSPFTQKAFNLKELDPDLPSKAKPKVAPPARGLLPQGAKPSSRGSLIQAPNPNSSPSPPLRVRKVVKAPEQTDADLAPPISPILLIQEPSAKKSYNEAFKALSARRFDKAIELFNRFLRRYPNDLDADNAQYWLGQAYFELHAWEGAEEAFRKVLVNYNHGDTQKGYKTPDAILMLGRLYKRKLRPSKARYYFAEVIKRYPRSRSAAKAREDLLNIQGPKR